MSLLNGFRFYYESTYYHYGEDGEDCIYKDKYIIKSLYSQEAVFNGKYIEIVADVEEWCYEYYKSLDNLRRRYKGYGPYKARIVFERDKFYELFKSGVLNAEFDDDDVLKSLCSAIE